MEEAFVIQHETEGYHCWTEGEREIKRFVTGTNQKILN